MGVRIVVPESVWGGFYKRVGRWAFGLMAHSLQCGQRWVFLIRFRSYIFGYRTHGDATPKLMTYKDGGWYWPWQDRWFSGRG